MKYRFVIPILSYLPDRALKWLMRHFPRVEYDPSDGWNLWLDASYHAYCRRDQRADEND